MTNTRDTALWLKCLLWDHEELSLNIQSPCKILAVGGRYCKPRAGRRLQVGTGEHNAIHPYLLRNDPVSSIQKQSKTSNTDLWPIDRQVRITEKALSVCLCMSLCVYDQLGSSQKKIVLMILEFLLMFSFLNIFLNCTYELQNRCKMSNHLFIIA